MNDTSKTVNRRNPSMYFSGALLTMLFALYAVHEPAHAGNEPFHLLIVRDAVDIRSQGECVRGQLFLVRSFDAVDVDRRVRVADTLEVLHTERGLSAPALIDGEYAGAVQESSKTGWAITLKSNSTVLRADRHNAVNEPAILLGRRAGNAEGPCELAGSRLEDGDVIIRRVQSLVRSIASGQPIAIQVRSNP